MSKLKYSEKHFEKMCKDQHDHQLIAKPKNRWESWGRKNASEREEESKKGKENKQEKKEERPIIVRRRHKEHVTQNETG